MVVPTPPTAIGFGLVQAVMPQSVPAPTGTVFNIAFVDANGKTWAIATDQAYIHILSQISMGHQGLAYTPSPSGLKPIGFGTPPMLEGDFSEGEMELAESIIAELEGGENKRRKSNQQEIAGSCPA